MRPLYLTTNQADKEQVEEAQSALKAALAGLTAKTEAGGSDTAGADTDTGNSGNRHSRLRKRN